MVTRTPVARRVTTWEATLQQNAFLMRAEYEVLYGGAKYGLKTDALLMWAILRRQKYPRSRGLFIRREITELTKQGAAWERCQEILGSSVRYNQTDHKVFLPNGSVLEFGHCHEENDRFHYQGAQYDDICVLRGTPVLMGDGSWKPIESIAIGEMVATMEGPRPVTQTWALGTQPVCEVRTHHGSAIISSSHRVLLADGTWASPNELLSRQYRSSDKPELGSLRKSQVVEMQPAYQHWNHQRVHVPAGRGTGGMVDQQSVAWSVDGQNGSVTSGDVHQARTQQEKWNGHLMQLSRVPRSMGYADSADDVPHVAYAASPLSSPNDYLGGRRSYGGHAPPLSGDDQESTQPLADVVTQSLATQRWDGQENTPIHNLPYYVHPYTKEIRDRVEDVRPVAACIVRAGVGEVFDLTIASASHFIVLPGIIAQNCFDQVEEFTWDIYRYIQGACRVPKDNPPVSADGKVIEARIRCSANPGEVGHAWVKAYFIDIAPPETSFTETVQVLSPAGVSIEVSRSRIFIPASVFDSIKAGIIDESYLATLNALPEPYRTAYLYGRWDLFVGQAFPEFGRQKHVIPYEALPETWRRIASHDWGFNAPGHHLWGAIDPEGGIIIYREFSFRHLDPQEIAQSILFRQGQEKITTVWADPSIWQERRHADLTNDQITTLSEAGKLQLSKAEQYQQAGLYCQPANNSRIAGKGLIHTLLKDRGDGKPYLRIMDTCPILIRTLQGIQIDPDRPEDVLTEYPPDGSLRDDAYDTLRYILMGLPVSLTPQKAVGVIERKYTWD